MNALATAMGILIGAALGAAACAMWLGAQLRRLKHEAQDLHARIQGAEIECTRLEAQAAAPKP